MGGGSKAHLAHAVSPRVQVHEHELARVICGGILSRITQGTIGVTRVESHGDMSTAKVVRVRCRKVAALLSGLLRFVGVQVDIRRSLDPHEKGRWNCSAQGAGKA